LPPELDAFKITTINPAACGQGIVFDRLSVAETATHI